jgi:hypothetical protein
MRPGEHAPKGISPAKNPPFLSCDPMQMPNDQEPRARPTQKGLLYVFLLKMGFLTLEKPRFHCFLDFLAI